MHWMLQIGSTETSYWTKLSALVYNNPIFPECASRCQKKGGDISGKTAALLTGLRGEKTPLEDSGSEDPSNKN